MIKDIQYYQPLLSILQTNLIFAKYSISINKEYKFPMRFKQIYFYTEDWKKSCNKYANM